MTRDLPRFDGVLSWSQLPPDVQAKIGALALELMIAAKTAHHAEEVGDAVMLRAANTAAPLLLRTFEATVETALDFSPAIPSLVGNVCEECGCTELDACADRCAWAWPGLCTSCAPAKVLS